MAIKKNTIKYFAEHDGFPEKIYYHYTTVEALFGIVSTQTIRLTSLRSSNDKKELFYTPEEFLTDFEKVFNNEKEEALKRYFKLVYDDAITHKTKFLKACKITSKPYAFCLAKKRDNLTHWDRYAANGTGVCIAINTNTLKVQVQRSGSELLGESIIDIGEAIYKDSLRQNTLRDELLSGLKLYSELNKLHENGGPSDLLNYIFAASIYSRIMKFSKNGSFIDEDEIRIYHDSQSIPTTLKLYESAINTIPSIIPVIENFKNYVSSIKIDEEKFMLSTQGIRSFKELCLSDVWGSGVIPEIVLGPMCSQNKYELNQFLKKYNLGDTKVTVSKVPIR